MPTVIPESLAEQIIAEKIREWEAKRKKTREQEDFDKIEVHPFLTISRDFGCGEEEIIPQLEKTLNWKVYGKNLLDFIANRDYLSRSFIETLDEHRQNLVDNWINFLIRSGSIMQDDYVVKISRLIKVIVSQESAIILGRGGNYILEDKKEGLRVRLTAPLETRVKNIAKIRNLPEKEAEKLVRDTDLERASFIKKYFDKEINHCEHFDLMFNTQNLSRDAICKIIILLLEEKKKQG